MDEDYSRQLKRERILKGLRNLKELLIIVGADFPTLPAYSIREGLDQIIEEVETIYD